MRVQLGNEITRKCVTLHQPNHDVIYDELNGEIVSIARGIEGSRLSVPVLRHANLQLTLKCNLACKYCRTSSSPRVSTNCELSTAEWIRTFDQLQEDGIQSVFATGGEIFSRPDIWELLAALEKRFIVHILTNGCALAAELSQSERQIISGLASIQISLDSDDPEVHDRLRGEGSWEKAIRALSVIHEIGVNSVISAVVAHNYTANITGLMQIAEGMGAKLLLRPLLAQGRGRNLAHKHISNISIDQIYLEHGTMPYCRGFLAYTEELHSFGITQADVPLCGVIAIAATGRIKTVLDA